MPRPYISPLDTLVHVWVAEAGWIREREHAIQAHILARWAVRFGLTLPVAAELRV